MAALRHAWPPPLDSTLLGAPSARVGRSGQDSCQQDLSLQGVMQGAPEQATMGMPQHSGQPLCLLGRHQPGTRHCWKRASSLTIRRLPGSAPTLSLNPCKGGSSGEAAESCGTPAWVEQLCALVDLIASVTCQGTGSWQRAAG